MGPQLGVQVGRTSGDQRNECFVSAGPRGAEHSHCVRTTSEYSLVGIRAFSRSRSAAQLAIAAVVVGLIASLAVGVLIGLTVRARGVSWPTKVESISTAVAAAAAIAAGIFAIRTFLLVVSSWPTRRPPTSCSVKNSEPSEPRDLL